MKVIEHLEGRRGRTLFSFEILPPLKGHSVESIYKAIDPLLEFGPSFIDVTYHREEVVYKTHANGLMEKTSVRKRPGTVGICAAIVNRYQIDAVPHLICGGFSKQETENALIDLHFLGIHNLLVLRGDALKTEPTFSPHPEGHNYAVDLLCQVMDMNKGIYLDTDMKDATASEFCIGVAGYPEKHFEAPNYDSDLRYLKRKVDAGAEYIVTQMFFDNQKYFHFVDACRRAGINVPIIPGLKPLTTRKQLYSLPRIFHIDIPDELVDWVENAKTEADVKQAGIDWAARQCKELMAANVPCLHFYTMGKSETTKAVARQIF